jgi:hypothetical protein
VIGVVLGWLLAVNDWIGGPTNAANDLRGLFVALVAVAATILIWKAVRESGGAPIAIASAVLVGTFAWWVARNPGRFDGVWNATVGKYL